MICRHIMGPVFETVYAMGISLLVQLLCDEVAAPQAFTQETKMAVCHSLIGSPVEKEHRAWGRVEGRRPIGADYGPSE